MIPPTYRARTITARALTCANLIAWLGGTLLVIGMMWIVAPPAGSAAMLASGAALLGTVAGLAAVALGVRSHAECSVVILGGSIIRASVGVLAGLLLQSSAEAHQRPFWVVFLIIIGVVMAAEVAASRRILLAGESA